MDTTPLRKYGLKARTRFFDAIKSRISSLGINQNHPRVSSKTTNQLQKSGLYLDHEILEIVDELSNLLENFSLEDLIEKIAYTWFNRLVAIRYMEVHKFLAHEILPHTVNNKFEELLTSRQRVAQFEHSGEKINFKNLNSAGHTKEQIFRALLVSQCNELHVAMPFLFEEITPTLAALLPEKLIGSDSLIGELVLSIPVESWKEGVEVIGWLYQYYIAEKKLKLTGKKLKPSEVAPATQLFTPRWIVRYLVQNTLGKKWLESNKSRVLSSRWEYLMPSKNAETKNKSQNKNTNPKKITPNSITVLDPACGSGHILVEAYDTIKDMYLERGFSPAEAAQLILSENLYGLDIDERATQMASFALLMRARIDDPHILNGGKTPVPHVYSLSSPIESQVIEATNVFFESSEQTHIVTKYSGDTRYKIPDFAESENLIEKISAQDFLILARQLNQAHLLGSLVTISESTLPTVISAVHFLNHKLKEGDPRVKKSALYLMQLVFKALLLCSQYDCVLANPPYLGSKFHPDELKQFLQENYKNFSRDLFSAFIWRNWTFAKPGGYLGFMSPFVWMFITSYKYLRSFILNETTITSLIKLQYSAFDGATVPICSFTLKKENIPDFKGAYINLEEFKGRDAQSPKVLEAIKYNESGWLFFRSHSDFLSLPEYPISFWLSEEAFRCFASNPKVSDIAQTRVGIQTSNNARFLRHWFEVDYNVIGFDLSSRKDALLSGKKWFPYNKGGKFRKWYGNQSWIVNFENDGEEIRNYLAQLRPTASGSLGDPDYQFTECVTWSDVSSSHFGARFLPKGFISDISGSGVFSKPEDLSFLCCYLCSSVASDFIKAINPTLHFQTGNISNLPLPKDGFENYRDVLNSIFIEATQIMSDEMCHHEESWHFKGLPFVSRNKKGELEKLIDQFVNYRRLQSSKLANLEHENNLIFCRLFDLQDPKEAESGALADTYPNWNTTECIKRFISFGVGVVLGRYLIEDASLITRRDQGRSYSLTPKDGIVCLDLNQQKDNTKDLSELLKLFISQTLGKDFLKRNLEYINEELREAENLTSADPLREYLFKNFYLDHCSIYSRRPIYWEIKSGRRQSFKGLIYYHNFNLQVLKSLRDRYVKPKISSLHQSLDNGKGGELKQADFIELKRFEENINLLISEKIKLNLNDGIITNLAKISSILNSKGYNYNDLDEVA